MLSGLRPLPEPVIGVVGRLLSVPPEAVAVPPSASRRFRRLRALLARTVEIVAHLRRVRPWTEAVLAACPDADVYHAKALIALPVARGAARRAAARFVYDVADIHTEAARLARMPAAVRSLIRRRERAWVREAAALTAVSGAVADEIARRFGVPRPVVVLNCPPRWRATESGVPSSTRLRDALRIAASRPVVVYQGGLSVDRGLEELVAALDAEPLRRLDAAVVLIGYGRLRDRLAAEASQRPGRLFLVDAVPVEDLLEWTAGADALHVGQPPRTLNQRLNLANKLFESLMAGVPVTVASGTEHCRFVQEHQVGRCCEIDDPRALASVLADLLGTPAPARARLREHCRRLALERYNWETQREGLLRMYRALAAAKREGAMRGKPARA